jgi:hypothetical protein
MRAVTTGSGVACVLAIAVVVILLGAPLSEVGAAEWAWAYGGLQADEGDCVVQTDDGGFVVAGTTTQFVEDNPDLWVVRLGSGGNVMWEKRYGGAGIESEASILEVPAAMGGGYLLTGVTESFGAGNSDLWALKLDDLGGVEWQFSYGGPDPEHSASVQLAPGNTGYVLAAKTESFTAGEPGDFWVLGLDTNGAISWQKRIGGASGGDVPTCVAQSGGETVVAGYTYSYGEGNGDFWVVSFDASGAISWQRTYGGDDIDWATAIKMTADGGYIVAGMSTSFTGGPDWDVWVLKLDSMGVITDEMAHGTTDLDMATSVDVTFGGVSYVVTGSTRSDAVGAPGDAWVMILDADLDIVEQHLYRGPDDSTNEHLDSCVFTDDVGVIAAGEADFTGEGGLDLWLLKTDANGAIGSCPAMQPWAATPIPSTGVSNVTTSVATTTSVSPFDTSPFSTTGDTSSAQSDGCSPEPCNLISIARTGQTTSQYPGDDGDLRAGAPWPADRFDNHADGTVSDTLTGLMWLRDANVAATIGHDPNGTGDGSMEWTAALDLVAGINDGTYTIPAPYDDWRMPNVNELESLANWGEDDVAAWLTAQGFSNVEPEYYWSSTTDVYQGDKSWCIDMSVGHLRTRFKVDRHHLWLVREGQDGMPNPAYPANISRTGQTSTYHPGDDGEHQRGVMWPSPRFVDYGDGTVTDTLTGLMWLQDCSCLGAVGWLDAIDTVADFGVNPSGYGCQDYTADHGDWRLPNRREFFSLLDFSRINGHPAFPADHRFVGVTPGWHWTSTSYAPIPDTWAWELETGYGGVSHTSKGVNGKIFAVRDVGERPWAAIFSDDFESGDTSAWSNTAP